jgi:hypothetical protein
MTRTRLVLSALVAAGALLPRAAHAAEWVEPKFNPPLGSRWVVERQLDVEKNSGGAMVGYTQKDKALLTIEAKTDTGFVVTYTRQEMSFEGDPVGAARERIQYQALQGLTVRIDTDESGKPVRIENWDEVKAALKRAAQTEPVTTANPEILAKARELSERALSVDDKQAAELFLDDLPTLAMSQNTGVKPGEIRKTVVPVANAFKAAVNKTVMMSIGEDDPEAGKVRYLLTETFDPESMKALVSEAVAGLKTSAMAGAVDQALKSMTVSAVTRAELYVEDGMTRELREEAVTSFRGPGSISVDTEDKLVTVKPAPASTPGS